VTRPSPEDLKTVAEASGWRRTSLHRDVLAFLERLAARTDLMRVLSMGRSGLGQDMPVAVLSADRHFTPAEARASGRPIVLVLANIHAGEVEGKEAVLMVARDATLGPLRRLIERATVLLVPDYNPDGNDRIDPSHRALDMKRLEGQIGPEGGVGTRFTGEGWNLNRDFTKQDAVETRHLARLMAEWRPHVVADCHTTDGSIHGYELTFDTSRNLGSCPAGPAPFVRDVLLPQVALSLRERTGFRTWFYGNFRDNENPSAGWNTYPPLCRYGSHFRGLLGTMDVLLEAYSYVDFETRGRVMHEILVELLDVVAERGPEVVRLVEAAAADAVARGLDPRPDDLVGISYGSEVRDATGALSFRHPGFPLFDHDIEAWDLASQRERRVPGRERKMYRATFHGRYEPTARVPRPFGYLVPASRTSVLERIASHQLEHRALPADVEMEVETYRVLARETTTSPDVGDAPRTETVLRVLPGLSIERIPAGTVFVPTAQPWGNLAVYLLEPHSDDGLARWGHFDDLRPGDAFPVRRVQRPVALPNA
jgi:hypothetical protein